MARSERRGLRALRGAALAASLIALAPPAGAQQAPSAAPPPAPPATTPPAPPATPVPQATPTTAPLAPVVDPPYDPSQHGWMPESVWLRATRGVARRSSGMMGTGIAMLGVGASLMVAGSILYVNDDGCLGPNNSCNDGKGTGMAVFISGLITAGLGIPLTIYGATDVPRAESGSARAPAPVTVGVGPGGRGLALRF